MIRAPSFHSHEQQRQVLGCAAELDPEKFPRRAALAKARSKMPGAPRRQAGENTLAARQRAEREYLLPIIREMAKTMTAMEVVKLTGKSRRLIDRLAEEGGFVFRNRHQQRKRAVDEFKNEGAS